MTEKDVFDVIKSRYADDAGYIVLPQVRNSTGFSGTVRTADALVFCAWPSRGFELWGIEIKVKRADWQKELMLPGKADVIAQYCDRWFVACPKGVVNVDELPKGWGLMVLSADGKKMTMKVTSKLAETQPITRGFLAAILRVAVGTVSSDAQLRKEYDRGVVDGMRQVREYKQLDHDRALSQAQDSLKSLKADVQAFERQAGFSISNGWKANSPETGAVVRHVLSTNFDDTVSIMKEKVRQVKAVIDRCDRMLEEMPKPCFPVRDVEVPECE